MNAKAWLLVAVLLAFVVLWIHLVMLSFHRLSAVNGDTDTLTSNPSQQQQLQSSNRTTQKTHLDKYAPSRDPQKAKMALSSHINNIHSRNFTTKTTQSQSLRKKAIRWPAYNGSNDRLATMVFSANKVARLYPLASDAYNSDDANKLTAAQRVAKKDMVWVDFLDVPRQQPSNIQAHTLPAWLHTCSATNTKGFNGSLQASSNVNSKSHFTTGGSLACDNEIGDGFIRQWKQRPVGGLCESNANSKIYCHDSPASKSRFCMFDNAMMSLKRMRTKTKADGTVTRQWEQGFLSTDCGDAAKADINYFAIYKPDIEGSSDAVCDYVFNETVVAYSHDNSLNYGHTMNDFVNVWSLLWLSGIADHSKDVTFLNIDGIRKGRFYNDKVNQYFSHYHHAFKRIIKLSDFDSKSTICFKRLIMQPKPIVLYTWDSWWSKMKCSMSGPSSIFQRWNLHIRRSYRLLPSQAPEATTNDRIQVLLFVRRGGGSGSLSSKDAVSSSGGSYHSKSSFSMIDEAYRSIVQHYISNKGPTLNSGAPGPEIVFLVQDLTHLTLEQQLRLLANTSILVTSQGVGAVNAMHMPLGTKYCCGVLEVAHTAHADKKLGQVHGNIAKRMGFQYKKVSAQQSQRSSSAYNYTTTAAIVSPESIALKMVSALDEMMAKITAKPSCVLSNVVDNLDFQKSV